MIFNSIEFGLFFPLVFFLYWLFFRKNIKARNLFIIFSSYFFYGVWDWRFLILIFISSIGDYLFGLHIHKASSIKRKKFFLISSITLNIGILGFFKYFNFFTENFIAVFTLLGNNFTHESLNIILPVGISFYTFQTMSYTLDIYHKKLEPTSDPFSFFAFVSFFPQLVAGPIERARNLLPQFYTPKFPEYETIKSGLLIIALGLFKKIVIADRLAIYVNSVYDNIGDANGFPMLIGVIFFAFQLYLDFSAYSDIAIGTAKTLGFNLSRNFNNPYLSGSFSDFWNRWHISLSSWFRDYVYIPLGGGRNGKYKKIKNILIVFILSGLWHGASWNFIIWGGINGFFLILLNGFVLKRYSLFFRSLIVFSCWTLSLVFFRAETFHDSFEVFLNLGFSNFDKLYDFGLNAFEFKLVSYLLLASMMLEFMEEKKIISIEWIGSRSKLIRYMFYISISLAILLFGSYGAGLNDNNFIYFQF